MSRARSSFRLRLVLGSLAWTAGLLYIAHLLSVLLIVGPGAFDMPLRISLMLPAALALMMVGFYVVRRALATFGELRRRLADVHEGRERQVGGAYPSEVQPVVDDLNALLVHHDGRVRDALAKAGDLAHGLRTPLAVLAQEAERAAAEGHHDQAATLAQQVERMRRHIEYHLAHARAAASGATPGARCVLADSATGVARTLERLHAQKGIAIAVDVPAVHVVRGQREDVDEMLGNLLDNACKWARSQVAVTAANGGDHVLVTVDDDGPGIVEGMREAVLQRGVRADEAAPGSGLGLAIVRDLAEVYGGTIVLGRSPLGGLRASLRLPDAPAERSAAVQEL